MRMVRACLSRIAGLFARQRRDRELAAELESHLALHVDDNLRAGMSPAEARRQALIKLGGLEQAKERYREQRGIPWLEDLWRDLCYATRMLRKNPGFTIVAILTLALGIGANTAIFTVVDAVLVRGLPFRDPARLVVLFQSWKGTKGLMGSAATGPDIFDWQRESGSFTSIAASLEDEGNLTGASTPQHVQGEKVTTNYFDLLGAQPALGRTFARGEDKPGRDHAIILSYSLWKTAFGGGAVLGRAVQLDDRTFTVIGVMPATFHSPRPWSNPEAAYWIPLPSTQLEAGRGEHMYAVFGRLKPGVTLAQARDEMDVIGRREAKEFPGTNGNFGVRVSPLAQVSLETFEEGSFHSVRPAILLLQFAAGFLLLIACANVANLLLFRLVGRQRELALRGAMGAGPWRLVRQLLTESALLSVLGGGAGVLLALWCKDALVGLAPKGYLPPTANVSLDWGVLAFTLGLAILCAFLFGCLPAMRAVRQDLTEALKGAGTGTARSSSMPHIRRTLVILELATTFLLLVGGGLMARSLASLLAVNPGFQPSNFFTARLSLPSDRYPQPEQIVRFFTAAQQRVARLPGINAVAFTSAGDFGLNNQSDVAIEGRARRRQDVWPQICDVTPGFFRAARIPILAGRDFSSADVSSNAKVALVSEAFANYFWPHQNPLEKHVRWGGEKGWLEVVGVVGNVRQVGLAAPSLPELYLPLSRATAASNTLMNVVVRSAMPPALLAREIEKQIWTIDPQIPLSEVRTGDQIMGEWAGYLRYRAVLLGSLALLGLLIAVVGIFGAMAYTTAQRTHEIGIRLALGAQRRDVLCLIVWQGAALVLIGLALGALGGIAITRVMRNLLYGVTPTDPTTFLSVAAALAVVALVACYVPARRAARVDPVVALREE